MRRVCSPDGELEQLGAGTVKISEQSARRLRRAHIGLLILAVPVALVALLCFFSGILLVNKKSKLTGRLITPACE